MQMSYAEYLEHFERVRQQKAAASTSVPNSQVAVLKSFCRFCRTVSNSTDWSEHHCGSCQ